MLLTFAMDEEHSGLFSGYHYIVTGIGKVNAAYALTKAIYENRPKMVINLGTAGSHFFPQKTIVNPILFKESDRCLEDIGIYDKMQFFGNRIEVLKTASCYTSDNLNIVKGHDINIKQCVFDMEAYALAYVCYHMNIPFYCLKYISDNAGTNMASDWKQSLKLAPQALYNAFQASNLIKINK